MSRLLATARQAARRLRLRRQRQFEDLHQIYRRHYPGYSTDTAHEDTDVEAGPVPVAPAAENAPVGPLQTIHEIDLQSDDSGGGDFEPGVGNDGRNAGDSDGSSCLDNSVAVTRSTFVQPDPFGDRPQVLASDDEFAEPPVPDPDDDDGNEADDEDDDERMINDPAAENVPRFEDALQPAEETRVDKFRRESVSLRARQHISDSALTAAFRLCQKYRDVVNHLGPKISYRHHVRIPTTREGPKIYDKYVIFRNGQIESKDRLSCIPSWIYKANKCVVVRTESYTTLKGTYVNFHQDYITRN